MDKIKICDYGCGKEAKFSFKNGKFCCSKHVSSCIYLREKTSKILKWRPISKDAIANRASAIEIKKLNNRKPEEIKKLCECGCEKFTNNGNRFIVGHNTKGKKLSKERIENLRITQLKSWKDPVIRENRINNIKKSKNTENGKQKIIKAGKLGGEAIRKKWKEDSDFANYMRKECKKGGVKSWSDEKMRTHLLEVRKTQWSDTAKKNMSISSKIRWTNPEEKNKLSKRGIERFKKPGERERQSRIISQVYIDGKLNNHGKFKSGYITTETCGDVFYQSSYEKRFIEILEFFFKGEWRRNFLKFKYFDGNIFRHYIPDYILPKENIFFEVKGWFPKNAVTKVINSSKLNHLKIYIIFEKDLKFLEKIIKTNESTFSFDSLVLIEDGEEKQFSLDKQKYVAGE